MMSLFTKLKNFKRPKWIRLLHRWIGVLVALPWIWLAMTGLLLRQQDTWNLHTRKIYSETLLKHYGVYPTEPPTTYEISGTKGQSVTLWGGNLYKDGIPLGHADHLIGAAAAGPYLAIGTGSRILLYDAQLELYDTLDELTLGTDTQSALGSGSRDYPVLFKSGEKTLALKNDFLSTKPAEDINLPNTAYSSPAEVSLEIMSMIKRYYAEDLGIPYARVILDLHSGNFFGSLGKLIIDLSAFLSIILTLLGLMLLKKKWKKTNTEKQ